MSKDSFLKIRRGKLHKKMFYMASTITQIDKSTKLYYKKFGFITSIVFNG